MHYSTFYAIVSFVITCITAFMGLKRLFFTKFTLQYLTFFKSFFLKKLTSIKNL
jgi:hypothetical protein